MLSLIPNQWWANLYVAVLVMFSLPFLLAPDAKASPAQDAVFYDILRSAGVEPGPRAVEVAGIVCAAAWQGVPPNTIVSRIYLDNYLSWDEAKHYTAAAIAVYCPPTRPGFVV